MTAAADHTFAARVSELIARLLCHQRQPGLRTRSSAYLLDAHRRGITACVKHNMALAEVLINPLWLEILWCDAVAIAAERTYALDFPDKCPWAMEQITAFGWLPPEAN